MHPSHGAARAWLPQRRGGAPPATGPDGRLPTPPQTRPPAGPPPTNAAKGLPRRIPRQPNLGPGPRSASSMRGPAKAAADHHGGRRNCRTLDRAGVADPCPNALTGRRHRLPEVVRRPSTAQPGQGWLDRPRGSGSGRGATRFVPESLHLRYLQSGRPPPLNAGEEGGRAAAGQAPPRLSHSRTPRREIQSLVHRIRHPGGPIRPAAASPHRRSSRWR